MSTAICIDQRKPSPISEPHGPWWLTVRIPLGRNRHAYIGAATADRFIVGRHTSGRVLVDRPRLAVLVMPRKFYGGRRLRGWVYLHRFCAHIHIAPSEVSS